MGQGIYRFKMKKPKNKNIIIVEYGFDDFTNNPCQVKDKSVKQKQTNNIEYIKIKL